MAIHKLFFIALFFLPSIHAANSKLYREYIGAMFEGVKFTDVPIDSNVEFHFILSFAIDYTTSSSPPSPTNGIFTEYWDSTNLSPDAVSSIKSQYSNVKVALSLGGATIGEGDQMVNVSFTVNPSSIDSWVENAVTSLTSIINKYHLDGIDIDYEKFQSDPETFAECIGRLISTLKQNQVISFASIAPVHYDQGPSNYLALWNRYGSLIDYVNFQFYAYDKGTTGSQFIDYFNTQSANYAGGKVLASFNTEKDAEGLLPGEEFFTACSTLQNQGKLNGIFTWCADASKAAGAGFPYEKRSQELLAMAT